CLATLSRLQIDQQFRRMNVEGACNTNSSRNSGAGGGLTGCLQGNVSGTLKGEFPGRGGNVFAQLRMLIFAALAAKSTASISFKLADFSQSQRFEDKQASHSLLRGNCNHSADGNVAISQRQPAVALQDLGAGTKAEFYLSWQPWLMQLNHRLVRAAPISNPTVVRSAPSANRRTRETLLFHQDIYFRSSKDSSVSREAHSAPKLGPRGPGPPRKYPHAKCLVQPLTNPTNLENGPKLAFRPLARPMGLRSLPKRLAPASGPTGSLTENLSRIGPVRLSKVNIATKPFGTTFGLMYNGAPFLRMSTRAGSTCALPPLGAIDSASHIRFRIRFHIWFCIRLLIRFRIHFQ
ncbi:unnamed protein product, partial [Cyprideis torosa]